jgi:CBS-domain-containing membrane protein
MHDHQLRRLPVVNSQGDLVGYLSMAKVARSERPAVSGKVIQGISQKSKPASMKAGGGKRSRKTG